MLSFQNRISSLDIFLSSVYLDGLILYENNSSFYHKLTSLKDTFHTKKIFQNNQHKKDIFPEIEKILFEGYGTNITQLKKKYFEEFFVLWKDLDSFWLETKIFNVNEILIEMLSEKTNTYVIKNLDTVTPKSINEILQNDFSKATTYRKMSNLINYGFIHVFGVDMEGHSKTTMFTKTFDQISLDIGKSVQLRLRINNLHLQTSKHIFNIEETKNYS